MHYIVATTLLFAASAIAGKQTDQAKQGNQFLPWNPHPRQWGPGRGGRWGNNGQPPLDYRVGCTCNTNQQEDPWTGQQACNQLAGIWGNLYWDDWNGACMDDRQVGIDVNGFTAACQRAAQGQNFDSFNPVAAYADCSPY